jgi:hypothetical protein
LNECEQIHPLLRGYLGETLSARERRLVARHLNLCASARKELDRLRILRWMFKTPKPAAKPAPEAGPKRSRGVKLPDQTLVSTPSPFRPVLGIILFFGGLALLTHLIQNAGENTLLKGAKRWLSRHHILGVGSSLELVLDLSSLPRWSGSAAPVAFPFHEFVSNPDRFRIYWQFLQPGIPLPEVDFSRNALAVVFLGWKNSAGHTVKFKRSESYTDKTVLWYDEVAPLPGEAAAAPARPWVLQLVPKPTQEPVFIQKIQ